MDFLWDVVLVPILFHTSINVSKEMSFSNWWPLSLGSHSLGLELILRVKDTYSHPFNSFPASACHVRRSLGWHSSLSRKRKKAGEEYAAQTRSSCCWRGLPSRLANRCRVIHRFSRNSLPDTSCYRPAINHFWLYPNGTKLAADQHELWICQGVPHWSITQQKEKLVASTSSLEKRITEGAQ